MHNINFLLFNHDTKIVCQIICKNKDKSKSKSKSEDEEESENKINISIRYSSVLMFHV